MIITSYFSNPKLKRIDPARLVAISRLAPKDFKGNYHLLDLAPHWSTLDRYKKDHDYLQYVKSYCKNRLRRLDVHEIAAKLDGKILLCYEKPGADVFCHRMIVMKWFLKSGYDCREAPFF